MENQRKYVGVPTQQEITQQFNELTEIVKDIVTFEQVLKLKEDRKEDIVIEINSESIKDYKNEPIEFIRYEYKNILIYSYIKDNKAEINPYITLYSDDEEQFGDELYNEYDKEIERVAEMGLLELINK